ncbi:RING finger protein 222 [Gadus morhua]|uniref:RING finger protein 222 n=1 Tax=Gadus morhua TaxID=8049 RepID=UPI0011B693E0|nr:RING finger protein 222-like [Gadus morhua]
MAFYKHEGLEEPTEPECPVCYESLSGSERTLSCGHVFCHDCLVRTLVSITRDGVIRDTIICPVCRHLTFIKKQTDAVVSMLNEEKEETKQGEQTLKVPIPAPAGAEYFAHYPGALLQSAARTVPLGFDWRRCFRRMGAFRRQILVFPNLDHNASQIFIISEQGRPMAEEDALRELSTVVVVQQPPVRPRRIKICTTGRWLLFLLSIFTLLALVAATLPWILLA